MRLVPPRIGEVERRTRKDGDAQRWTAGLRTDQRRRMLMLAGNLLLLAVLLGLPFLRGHRRALEAKDAHARFVACLYGGKVAGGLGDLAGEAEYLAAQIARTDRAWPARCNEQRDAIAISPAFFVLPAVKVAEAHVREALLIVRGELDGLSKRSPGTRMPERALRALRLLRATLREQLTSTGLDAPGIELPQRLDDAPKLPAPARLPLYAAPDAALTLWGDDQKLQIAALDATGVAYLEAQGGQPFTRARLVRPSSLRSLVSLDRRWLVWATAPARCAQRGDSCYGKTMRVAAAPDPLLELPAARTLAGHIAGRPDRSLAAMEHGLLVATRERGGRVAVQSFALPKETPANAELPALAAQTTWPQRVDDALLLDSPHGPAVLAVAREESAWKLEKIEANSAESLGEITGDGPVWLSGCADRQRTAFAFGDDERVVIGSRAHAGLHVWSTQRAAIERAIDRDDAQRDRVRTLCSAQGVLVVLREADDRLSLLSCRDQETSCRKLSLAPEVEHFSALLGERAALFAYAGKARAQVRVRSLDLATLKLGPERIPAACWSQSGLCTRPSLARVGSRIVLATADKTDLLVLESADEGATWSAPPVL